MEPMDCNSPINSVSENEEVPPKKPKVAKIKPMLRTPDSKGKNPPRRPLTPIDQNAMDVRESESFENSLEIDVGTNMLLEDLESESGKENRELALPTFENVSEFNFHMNVDDISQTEIEYLIHLENGGIVSPRTDAAFKVHRAQCSKANVTSLSDTGETEWNSLEEMNVRNKKKTSQKPKVRRSRSFKKRSAVMSDTSDDSDCTDRENEKSVTIKHKPLKIKKGRPSTSAAVSKVRNTPVEEYDDEADDEPELIQETKVSQSGSKITSARLKRIMMRNDSNGQDNEAGAAEEDISDETDSTIEENAAMSLVAELSEKLLEEMNDSEGYELDDDISDEVEKGFQSNDCNEFSEVLHINNNNEDLAIPGCSKTHDKPVSPPPPQILLREYDSGSDIDEPGPSRPPTKRPRTPNSPNSTDSETDGEEGSIQAIRKANKKRIRQLLKKFRNEELENNLTSQQVKGKSLKKGKAPLKRKRGSRDESYKFQGSIPTEKRRSARLQNKNPEYNHEALNEVQETLKHIYLKRPNYNLDDYLPEELDDLEKVVHKPKRKSFKKKIEEHVIIPVENVTRKMLDNIAVRVKGKVYSADGTTCHQCRQKTMDQKTCCRSPDCSGMMGMFCGVCIKNRYGENAADALLNPKWICPVCRGKCNCSICRTKQGKRPTGVLAPLAQQNGYESVDHFLDNLRGEGDRAKDDHKYKLKRDPEAVLGFSNNGCTVHLQDGSCHLLRCTACILKECDNPKNLLGFSKDGNYAMMGGRREEPVFKPKTYFFSLLRLKHA